MLTVALNCAAAAAAANAAFEVVEAGDDLGSSPLLSLRSFCPLDAFVGDEVILLSSSLSEDAGLALDAGLLLLFPLLFRSLASASLARDSVMRFRVSAEVIRRASSI